MLLSGSITDLPFVTALFHLTLSSRFLHDVERESDGRFFSRLYDVPHFLSPFIHQWTSELFLPVLAAVNAAAWTLVYEYLFEISLFSSFGYARSVRKVSSHGE